MSYILHLMDSARFMASSLSNFVNNIFEGLHRMKYKLGHYDNKCESCGMEYKYCHCSSICKISRWFNKGLICSKNCRINFDKKVKERLFNPHTFSNGDNNKFILSLQKGVYPYEYTDDWEKFNETSLPRKEGFYSHLNMEDITDADYAHAKRDCKDFEKKKLGEYHDLYVESDTLFLPDIFENFRNMCLETY